MEHLRRENLLFESYLIRHQDDLIQEEEVKESKTKKSKKIKKKLKKKKCYLLMKNII